MNNDSENLPIMNDSGDNLNERAMRNLKFAQMLHLRRGGNEVMQALPEHPAEQDQKEPQKNKPKRHVNDDKTQMGWHDEEDI